MNKLLNRSYWLIVSPSVLLACVLLCIPSASAQSESTPPPFPQPGRLIDIGGGGLHLNFTGEARASQTTGILESGLGGFFLEWGVVPPGVGQFARVFSFDRPRGGASGPGPPPRPS